VFDGRDQERATVLEREAIEYLTERIALQVTAEGGHLSAYERSLLVNRGATEDDDGPEESDARALVRLTGFLRRSYLAQQTAEARRQMLEAGIASANSESYMSAIVRGAGLHSPLRARLLPLRSSALILVLAGPGVGALLTAAVLLWGAASGSDIRPGTRSGMAGLAVMVGGLGLHLLAVWRNDRRA
jgi:hypothetical protein